MMHRRTKRQMRVAAAASVVVAAALAATGAMVWGAQNQPLPPAPPSASSYLASQEAAPPVVDESVKFTPVPTGAPVLIIGDSYTQGYGADDQKTQGYAYILGKAYGWNTVVDAVGRTGFWSGGGSDRKDKNTYIERLERRAATGLKPSLVIFQASQNDYKATSSELVTRTIAAVESARKHWPKAQVVILGTAAPLPKGASLSPINQATYRGAVSTKTLFLNAMRDGWMNAQNSAEYKFTDGWHLNTSGHAYLASKIKETLDAYARG